MITADGTEVLIVRALNVVTESGSVYCFRERSDGVREVDISVSVPNPAVSGTYRDGFMACTVTTWPPVVGEVMEIKRPDVPWGQGQWKITSPVVRLIEVPV